MPTGCSAQARFCLLCYLVQSTMRARHQKRLKTQAKKYVMKSEDKEKSELDGEVG
uniref:Zinc finger protein 862 n=1 Tax=Nothobranchius kadleci TaxID=1051664 RepID=A0A1A8C3C1_NOTKA